MLDTLLWRSVEGKETNHWYPKSAKWCKNVFRHLIGQFKFCHYLLTLMYYQTCMSFFLLFRKKDDILKNVGKQTVDVPIDFHSIFSHTMEVNGYRQLFGCLHSSKYLPLGSEERKKLIQVWNNVWVSKPNRWVTKLLTVAIDFHLIFFHTTDVSGYRQLFVYQHSSKYLLLG